MQNSQNMRHAKLNNKKPFLRVIAIIVGIVIIILVAWKGCAKKNGEWICKNGEWVVEGETTKPKPETECIGDMAQQAQKERVKPAAEFIEVDSARPVEGIDIRVFSPHVNGTIESPLKITGEAKGWFVDQKLIVQLIDEKGIVLVNTEAKASTDINEEEYVPFEAMIEFDAKNMKAGDLVFQKVNPSNDPSQARTFSFPVFFE